MFDITKAYIREREKDDQRVACAKVLQKIQGEEDFIKREDIVDRKRLWKMKQLETQQMEVIHAIQRKKQMSDTQRRIIEDEERIACELKKKMDQEVSREALRKKIRQSSEEIRELEEKLRAAYVAKTQRAQIAERRAQTFDQMMEDNAYYKGLETERQKIEEIEAASAHEEVVKVKQYQEQLELQILEKAKIKEEMEAEKQSDRRRIDLEVQKLKQEDEEVRAKDQLYKEHLKAIILETRALRAQEREERQKELEVEEKRIALDEERLRSRQNEIKEAKETRQAELEAVQIQLGEIMHAKEQERKELDEIRMELSLEEEETRAFEHERVEEERRRKARAELQADKQKQFEEHQRQKMAQQAEEEAIKQAMLAKFAEDDKLEQLSNQRRRQKMMEHKKAADDFIEQRRRQKEELKARDEEKMIRDAEIQKVYDSLVEEERLKILERHAPNLVGYLTKGVIKTEDDLARLGENVKTYYKHRPSTFEYNK